MKSSNEHLLLTLQLHAPMLYNALLVIVRANAQGHPYGHDAIVNARKVLASATLRTGKQIDWAKEKKL